MRYFLFLWLAGSAVAQSWTKTTVNFEFAKLTDAVVARSEIQTKTALFKSIQPGDVSPAIFTNSAGLRVVSFLDFYASKPAMRQATNWLATNAWAAGTRITITTHLCPHTNDVPAGWLGCAQDPRAEYQTIVIKK